jgi:hypothetical protein
MMFRKLKNWCGQLGGNRRPPANRIATRPPLGVRQGFIRQSACFVRQIPQNARGDLMHPASARLGRAATLLTAFLLTAGPLAAQDAKPAAPAPPRTANKLEIWSGPMRRVYYSVPNGSPHVQALYRRLQWAENEVTIVEQLQQLKMDYVNNERRLEAFRTAQQLTYAPWVAGGCYYAGGASCESSLKSSLSGMLAQESTTESALGLFHLLEQAQTDVAAEQLKRSLPTPRMPPAQTKAIPKAAVASHGRPKARPASGPTVQPSPLLPVGARFVGDARLSFPARTVGYALLR